MSTFKVALVAYDAPGIPDWVTNRIHAAGIEFVGRQCANQEELIETARDADVAWVFGGPKIIRPESLDHFDRCGAILRSGSGTDNIPVPRATELGIIACNTPQATSDSVSDHAIALIFAVARHILVQDRNVRGGKWDFRATAPPMRLYQKTLGLIGFGQISKHLLSKLRGYDLTVLAHDPYVGEDVMEEHGARKAALNDLLAQANIVSIHCPLKDDTRHLIGEPELRQMKPNAILINTSRGAVIDEQALVRALTEGWIAGAGLDVLEGESADPENPIMKLDNVVLTPHMASYSEDHQGPVWEYSVRTVIELSRTRRPLSWVNPQTKPRWDAVATDS